MFFISIDLIMAIFSKTYGKILAALLACLGFTCTECAKDEYGTPTATFKAKGTVVSQEDDAPIEGIRAVLKARHTTDQPFFGMDTVYTDSKGVFNLKSRKGEMDFRKLYVELSDVDGDENGAFTDKDIEADYSNAKFKGGNGHWYRGEAEKDLGVIKMEPKE